MAIDHAPTGVGGATQSQLTCASLTQPFTILPINPSNIPTIPSWKVRTGLLSIYNIAIQYRHTYLVFLSSHISYRHGPLDSVVDFTQLYGDTYILL